MTTVVLRPEARVSAVGLTDNSATVWQRLDDDPPDTSPGSVVEATGSAKAELVVDLSTFVLPAGALVTSAQVGMHGRAVSSQPGQGRAQLRKADGTVLVSLIDSQFRGTWRTAKSADTPVVLSQADIDGLRIWARTNTKQSGPWPIKLAELYAWITYVARPVTTIVDTPTSVGVSSVTVAWSVVFDPGGLQSHYRVVLLTAAQVASVVGGDPLSVPLPVTDTGDVSGPAASVVLSGLPAMTGGTLFVRSAQMVNGQPLWSAWTSQALTVVLTVADVDAVTTTPGTADGGVPVTVTRLVGSDPWLSVEVERARWIGGLTDEAGLPLFDEDGQALQADDATDPFVTVWERVAGSPFAASGNTLSLVDFGSAPNTGYVWRARALNAAGSVGQWVYSLPDEWELLTGQMWLKAADDPAQALRVWVVTAPLAEGRGRQQIVHEIVPDGVTLARRVVSVWPLQGRDTTIDCWTETAEEADRLVGIVGTGAVLVHPPADWRFVPGRFAVGPLVEDVGDEVGTPYPYRRWRLELIEVDE